MHRSRLGFLYPGHAAEDDYTDLEGRLDAGPVVEVVHTSVGEDAHRVDALLDLGGDDRLLEGAAQLVGKVDVVVWACTSGSFVFGWDGARHQIDVLAEHLGVPASSTSFAFVEAASSIHATRVAVAATYPRDVADAFADFLSQADIEVLATGANDIVTAEEVGTLDRERVIDLVRSADHADADAILVPDTALHTVAFLPALEAAVAKPVLTANQVTMWEALRLAGALRPEVALGRLFEQG